MGAPLGPGKWRPRPISPNGVKFGWGDHPPYWGSPLAPQPHAVMGVTGGDPAVTRLLGWGEGVPRDPHPGPTGATAWGAGSSGCRVSATAPASR